MPNSSYLGGGSVEKELLLHWRELLKPLFPTSAYIRIRVNKSAVIGVDWRLKEQNEGPDRFSRLIKILVSERALQHYLKLSSAQKHKVDQKLVADLQSRLSRFNPNHDTPPGGIPPFEEWIVDDQIMN